MKLAIETTRKDVTLNIGIKGTLDYSTMSEFEQLVEIPDDIKHVTIDFSEMDFIDSTGLGSIIEIIHLSKEQGFRLEFVGVNEIVQEIFKTVGLYHILESVQKGG